MPKPFLTHQSMFDPSFKHGWWYYFRSADLATLTDDVVDIVAKNAQTMTSTMTASSIFQLGGAISRVGEDETAYNGRDHGHTININSTTEFEEGFEEGGSGRETWEELSPYHQGVYVNFMMDEDEERVRQAAYGPAKYERLAKLKAKYDPQNLFSLNQNIAGASVRGVSLPHHGLRLSARPGLLGLGERGAFRPCCSRGRGGNSRRRGRCGGCGAVAEGAADGAVVGGAAGEDVGGEGGVGEDHAAEADHGSAAAPTTAWATLGSQSWRYE